MSLVAFMSLITNAHAMSGPKTSQNQPVMSPFLAGFDWFWLVLGQLIAIPNADRIDGVPEAEGR